MNRFTRTELYLFSFLTIFAVFWMSLIMPYLTNSSIFSNLNPVIQYFLFNVGMIILVMVIINIPYKLVSKEKVNLNQMIKMGLSGWLLFSFIYDLWQPPYYLSPIGQILITAQQALPNTAVDAMLSYVWSQIIPTNLFFGTISVLYLSVYVFTPIIAVGVIILIFKPSLVKKVVLQQ